jgi:hypothetical protein
MFIASGLLGHALVRVPRTSDLRETNHGVNPRLLPTFSLDRRSFDAGGLPQPADCPSVLCSAFAKASADDGSTGNKQTLNGLFYLIAKQMFKSNLAFQRSFFLPYDKIER